MTAKDNIDEKLQNLSSSIGSDEKFVENVMSRIEAKPTSKLSQAKTQNIWSIIMKSQITKLASAAIIIIAVLLINYQFSDSNVLWAEVVEQISNHTKYKCRQRIIRDEGPQIPSRLVYHLNLQQRRQEHEDGIICIIDMRPEDAISIELHPDEKKAFLTKSIGFGPRNDPDIIDMVQKFDEKSTERLGTKKKDGEILYGFRHKPNEHNDFTVWVAQDTKLPVEIELKHPTAGQTIFMDEFEYDFDLGPSAFSTEIPDGYEVETIFTDYREVEPRQVTVEEIDQELNQTAYMLEQLPWIKQQIIIRTVDPLGTRLIVYMIGIKTDDGNTIIIGQGDVFNMERMVWIPEQQIVLETTLGIKLYTHPNGGIFAQRFLESFADAEPDFFDKESLSEERFTRMIVMSNGKVLSLSANKKLSLEKMQELVESIVEVK